VTMVTLALRLLPGEQENISGLGLAGA
jgi:hypothetical protein